MYGISCVPNSRCQSPAYAPERALLMPPVSQPHIPSHEQTPRVIVEGGEARRSPAAGSRVGLISASPQPRRHPIVIQTPASHPSVCLDCIRTEAAKLERATFVCVPALFERPRVGHVRQGERQARGVCVSGKKQMRRPRRLESRRLAWSLLFWSELLAE